MSASPSGEEDGEVQVGIGEDGGTLPLIVRPRPGRDSAAFLQTWISAHTSWIDKKLLQHGAILFRGFQVKSGSDFQTAVQQYNPDLSNEYRGTSPRRLIGGTEYVFSASELPPSYPIPQHIEMSFLPAPPRKLFFCCLEAPTSTGGETCLCDFKKVYEQLDPSIREEFETKQLLYSRYYTATKARFSDPTMMKGWHSVFQTQDKAKVEEELRGSGQDFSWRGDDLRITSQQTAVETHPVTGQKIWFNHILVFHFSMLSSELYRVYRRIGGLKYWFYSWMYWFMKIFFLRVLGPARVGFHTSFGDGSQIPESHLEHLRDVVWRNLVFNRWEQGDIVMIDNFRISHGRQPFSGGRKIVVAWSQPELKPSLKNS